MSSLKLDVELISKSPTELRIKIPNEGHTLGNLITKLASKKPHVNMAVYYVEHPLKQNLFITIRTDGQIDPLDALLQTIDEAINYLEKFKEELEEGK
ncbi:hypothetical protein EYM_03405 [Ignicoccus islandicus DSM 13165]|uniref:DNA-directed RNA polymerase subunit Rpo11 n=1 Tax=Ignicoccus islandicus DSM 13165 TaxID=940295 RepID=A0A0U2U8M1_9CREN|nr:RpoL/Rpb11 RNA polymerase subunit family protein [Ignicoccus islandicus]ALU12404.1 hypothetical protein EYM_03405 [Ignicoccus islandicus DSM 13165]